MAIISFLPGDSWIVARWAFRLIMERASIAANSEDRFALHQAIALDGLHFDLVEAGQASRLAMAIESAARQLHSELDRSEDDDPRDREFAGALTRLLSLLHR